MQTAAKLSFGEKKISRTNLSLKNAMGSERECIMIIIIREVQ